MDLWVRLAGVEAGLRVHVAQGGLHPRVQPPLLAGGHLPPRQREDGKGGAARGGRGAPVSRLGSNALPFLCPQPGRVVTLLEDCGVSTGGAGGRPGRGVPAPPPGKVCRQPSALEPRRDRGGGVGWVTFLCPVISCAETPRVREP